MVYKVFLVNEWKEFKNSGQFKGSGLDIKDGYIHLSSEDQLEETIVKHFIGQRPLIVAEFDEKDLLDGLKWEPSRQGELFPHYYGKLLFKKVQSHHQRS